MGVVPQKGYYSTTIITTVATMTAAVAADNTNVQS